MKHAETYACNSNNYIYKISLQLPFWNGCDEDDHCVPDLVLQSKTDLMNRK